ncbi:hypothetical protein ILYODFUR_026936 [Ilyodon furcidens]|uniref:Uncharacterized protein n=1 Tax=Ilyodon furcidens TaxID=33524 RepID=A0ABV0T1Y9_9TELE
MYSFDPFFAKVILNVVETNDVLLLLSGDLCDLILVFFDPMGQALCKRTLNIVECLNEKHGDRLRFYLSKADEAGGESDRQVNSATDLSRSSSTLVELKCFAKVFIPLTLFFCPRIIFICQVCTQKQGIWIYITGFITHR